MCVAGAFYFFFFLIILFFIFIKRANQNKIPDITKFSAFPIRMESFHGSQLPLFYFS